MLELEVTPLADQDLLNIWLYSAETWSVPQADRYSDDVYDTFKTLCSMPDLARERFEFDPPIHAHPTGKHIIIYRHDAKTLTILRVLAQRQNWISILSK